MKLGIVLLIVFVSNLIYSLFFTMGEPFASHIFGIILSIGMIIWAICRIKGRRKPRSNDTNNN